MQRFSFAAAIIAAAIFSDCCALAQSPSQGLEIDRKGETIVLEPFAPNIIRVTLSLKKDAALAVPGYGIIGTPAPAGWSATETPQANVYQSGRIVATIDKD